MKEVTLLCSFGKPSSNSSNKHDGSVSKRICLQGRRHKRCRYDPWVGKIPWRRKWQPTLVFLPEESMDRGAWWATVQRVGHDNVSVHTHTIWLSNSTTRHIPKRNENIYTQKLKNVYSSIIYNSQKVETSILPSTDKRINKMWCISNRIFYSVMERN